MKTNYKDAIDKYTTWKKGTPVEDRAYTSFKESLTPYYLDSHKPEIQDHLAQFIEHLGKSNPTVKLDFPNSELSTVEFTFLDIYRCLLQTFDTDNARLLYYREPEYYAPTFNIYSLSREAIKENKGTYRDHAILYTPIIGKYRIAINRGEVPSEHAWGKAVPLPDGTKYGASYYALVFLVRMLTDESRKVISDLGIDGDTLRGIDSGEYAGSEVLNYDSKFRNSIFDLRKVDLLSKFFNPDSPLFYSKEVFDLGEAYSKKVTSYSKPDLSDLTYYHITDIISYMIESTLNPFVKGRFVEGTMVRKDAGYNGTAPCLDSDNEELADNCTQALESSIHPRSLTIVSTSLVNSVVSGIKEDGRDMHRAYIGFNMNRALTSVASLIFINIARHQETELGGYGEEEFNRAKEDFNMEEMDSHKINHIFFEAIQEMVNCVNTQVPAHWKPATTLFLASEFGREQAFDPFVRNFDGGLSRCPISCGGIMSKLNVGNALVSYDYDIIPNTRGNNMAKFYIAESGDVHKLDEESLETLAKFAGVASKHIHHKFYRFKERFELISKIVEDGEFGDYLHKKVENLKTNRYGMQTLPSCGDTIITTQGSGIGVDHKYFEFKKGIELPIGTKLDKLVSKNVSALSQSTTQSCLADMLDEEAILHKSKAALVKNQLVASKKEEGQE